MAVGASVLDGEAIAQAHGHPRTAWHFQLVDDAFDVCSKVGMESVTYHRLDVPVQAERRTREVGHFNPFTPRHLSVALPTLIILQAGFVLFVQGRQLKESTCRESSNTYLLIIYDAV